MTDWPVLPDLPAALFALVAQVPAGRVTTFGQLAEALGDRQAARWAASQLGACAADDPLPWQRVIRLPSQLASGTTERQQRQIVRLASEGLAVDADGNVLLNEPCWTDFTTSWPLKALAAWQTTKVAMPSDVLWETLPDVIGGLDVSYAGDDLAVAAAVLVDVTTDRLLDSQVAVHPSPFPYISGYLTFRELPALLAVLAMVERQGWPPVLWLVDGSGRLHPRGAGLATALSRVTGRATIGVAKHRLCGVVSQQVTVGGVPAVVWEERVVGGLVARGGQLPGVYVSAGGGVSLETAVRVVTSAWRSRRWPTPIWHADAISRRTARDGKRPAIEAPCA